MSQENISDTAPVEGETDLTFGLELEFILATVDEGKPDPHPKDPREVDGKKLSSTFVIDQEIGKKLRAVGIPAIVEEEKPTKEEYKTCWVMKSDITVGDDEDGPGKVTQEWNELYTKNGMEISSPPYYYTKPAKDAITKVLKTIRENYRVCVDGTAGLHVHVGNSYNGLQFPILKHLLAIAHTYEPLLMLIFPSERVSDNPWCPPLFNSRLTKKHPDLTRAEVLENILGYTDNESLLYDFGESLGSGRLGFNLVGLATPYKNEQRTIEFRHHHGSLDPEAILNWIHVCIKLVEKACFAKSDELSTQLRQDIAKPIGFDEGDLSTIDFFMWLGCPAQAYYYCANMVTDKDALKQRIEYDATCREHFLKWARHRLQVEAEDSGEDEGQDSSKESEPTTSNSESTDENEADQDEGNDESGDSGENPSNSNEDDS
ncbi:uncharacterized protein EAE98_007502 [Botrytis deweyae]|uniref:Amidoligase enzyme n=1 Tax=Botrytis deweyae TaxID=2478750 RepID=A0ABQ7IGG0_9HELO|nr:uncharacterized protein EAE98_007502 [Botrytis deweyae]KAF7923684.1 hypothetical protein EAE98_007502 [Botrytis deweyae]